MTHSTEHDGRSENAKPRSPDREALRPAEQDVEALKRTLQEKRRALTLAQAEAEKERELREALQAQLLDANAEIVASWDRRKEMARVISDQQAKLAHVKEADNRVADLEKRIRRLEQVVANRDEAIAKRDKVLASRQDVIANREAKISELKAQLRARYEELAVLERHIVQSTISGKAKRLARQARNLTRKSFQGS